MKNHKFQKSTLLKQHKQTKMTTTLQTMKINHKHLVLAQLELRADLSLDVNTIKHFGMGRDIVVKFEAYQEYLVDPTSLKKLPSLED